jgi:hypothetical protein
MAFSEIELKRIDATVDRIDRHIGKPVFNKPLQVVAQRFERKSGDQEEIGSHPAAPPSPISLLVASSALS